LSWISTYARVSPTLAKIDHVNELDFKIAMTALRLGQTPLRRSAEFSLRRRSAKLPPRMHRRARQTLALLLPRPPWICKRCFCAFTDERLPRARQSDPPTPSEDNNLSPLEIFRRRFLKAEEEVPKTSVSPWESFGRSEPEKSISLGGTPTVTFEELAAAYRNKDSLVVEEEEEIERAGVSVAVEEYASSDELAAADWPEDLDNLTKQDDFEEVEEVESFDGENVREYQGVLPLKGKEYVHEKFPVKQGSLVEIRG
jgi:hypothetical protein